MKIKSFESDKLNGYLDFNLHFHNNHSFLIGINGSGKTSVLKAIVGLLGPDVDWLMNTTLNSVSVSIENDGQLITIKAEAVASGKAISVLLNGEPFLQDLLPTDKYRSLVRHAASYIYEEDGEMISVADAKTAIPTGFESFEFIRQLPSPIYLGLDRSTLPVTNRKRTSRNVRNTRAPHATLRAFLDDSVAEAEEAAVSAVRRASTQRQNEAIDLRKKILLTLFIDPKQGKTSKLLPSAADVKLYEQYRKSIKAAFKALGLNVDDVAAAIDPLFSKLISLASNLQGISMEDVFAKDKEHLWDSYRQWTELAPRIQIFEQAEALVKKFNSLERRLFDQRDRYLSIMRSFLNDSSKEFMFEDDGSLALRLPSGKIASVFYLSSGERQLFVLITTLMFVQDQKRANILIIDEPELSLHMKWQEMFVDSLLEANNDVQLILATHSPAIILDRTEYCLDLA